ncbi:MAG: hypothetical protein PVG77_01140 [Nitrosopumilaceae archaeon]
MKPKATGALVVIVFLFSIVTILPNYLAYATSSEKILLKQQFEQFPGQKISGYCNLKFTDDGHLEWSMRVDGLQSGTKGHFDLNHWIGETDVHFIANGEGKAGSENQIVKIDGFAQSLFSKFLKCQVHTAGRTHFTSPVIALGVPGSSNNDHVENNNEVSSGDESLNKDSSQIALAESSFTESKNNDSNLVKSQKFFLFTTLDYVFGLFNNNNQNQNTDSFSSENISPGLSRANNKKSSDDFSPLGFIFGPPSPFENTIKDKGPTEKGSDDKGPTEKGSDDKGPTEKGSDDKGPTEKGSDDKGPTEKGSDDKKPKNGESSNEDPPEKDSVNKDSAETDTEDKDSSKKNSENKGAEQSTDSIKCSPGQKKNGIC